MRGDAGRCRKRSELYEAFVRNGGSYRGIRRYANVPFPCHVWLVHTHTHTHTHTCANIRKRFVHSFTPAHMSASTRRKHLVEPGHAVEEFALQDPSTYSAGLWALAADEEDSEEADIDPF